MFHVLTCGYGQGGKEKGLWRMEEKTECWRVRGWKKKYKGPAKNSCYFRECKGFKSWFTDITGGFRLTQAPCRWRFARYSVFLVYFIMFWSVVVTEIEKGEPRTRMACVDIKKGFLQYTQAEEKLSVILGGPRPDQLSKERKWSFFYQFTNYSTHSVGKQNLLVLSFLFLVFLNYAQRWGKVGLYSVVTDATAMCHSPAAGAVTFCFLVWDR